VPSPRIELRHVHCVIAAAETGSFRRAGQALGTEQSAVSRRVREVEDEIGGPLFSRHSAGIKLTEIGQSFIKRIRPAAVEIGLAIDEVRAEAKEKPELQIGIFGPISMDFLVDLFSVFRRERPHVALKYSEGSSTELIASVRQRHLDLGIVANATTGKGYELVHLWNEPVYLAMPEADPLAGRKLIHWEDLRSRHLLVTDLPTGHFAKSYLDENLAGLSVDVRVDQLAVTRESLMQIVAHGDGVAFAVSAQISLSLSGLVFCRIANAVLKYSLAHARHAAHKHIEDFIELAKAFSESNGNSVRSRTLAGDAWPADASVVRRSQNRDTRQRRARS